MIARRPGKRAIASQAPNGAPIRSAMTLADRLTRSDRPTMPSSSGSRRPIREIAATTDRAKSFIQPTPCPSGAASFPVGLDAMGMRMPVRMLLDRHHHDMAVAYAALGDDAVGERLHLAAAPLQHRDLEAGIVVDMHMQRGLGEVVMLVIVVGQPLRQFAGGMVVDIAERGDAVAVARCGGAGVLKAAAQEIAKRLRAVGVAMLRNEPVDLGKQVVIDGDGQALHSSSPGGQFLHWQYDEFRLTSYYREHSVSQHSTSRSAMQCLVHEKIVAGRTARRGLA